MVHFKITLPDLEGRQHTATIYEILDENLQVIYSSGEKYEDLIEYTLNLELIEGRTYYSRARYATEPGGLSAWSENFMFVSRNTNEVLMNFYFPNKIKPSSISTIFDKTNHPGGLFTITSVIDKVNNNQHKSSSWLITSIPKKEVVFSSIDDVVNLNKLKFDKILSPGIYLIQHSANFGSGDSSEFSGLIVNVLNESKEDFHIVDSKTEYNGNKITKLVTTIPNGYVSTDVVIYEDGVVVDSFNTIGSEVTIDTSVYKTKDILITLQANYSSGSKSKILYRYVLLKFTQNYLPGNLPYILG